MVYSKATAEKFKSHFDGKNYTLYLDIRLNLLQAIAVTNYVHVMLQCKVLVNLGHKKWRNVSLITVRASFQ